MYINSINYFRGISIMFIVFGHCLFLADFTYTSLLGSTIQNLTQGGTSFFVFISGFLFHHIFYKKFEFKGFMIKKTKYVLVPYLILSTIPIVYLLLKIFTKSLLSNHLSIQYEELYFFPLWSHYLTGVGKSYIGYWYIPFIMVIFVMSPLFIRFIKLKLNTSILITFLLLIGSVFMHKGTYLYTFSIFQNIIFFLPIYLIGIISSEKKDFLFSKMEGKEFYVLSVALGLAIIQAYIGELGNYQKDPFVFGGIDLMILQKILLCLFFIVFLNRFENYSLKFLELIAANSFGLFFIHGIVIAFFQTFKAKFDFSFTTNSFIIYCMVASLVFFLSLILTLLIKKMFPRNSKYLVGI